MKGRIEEFLTTISLWGLLIALVLTAVIGIGRIQENRKEASLITEQTVLCEIVVQAGDTLWSIASQNVPEKDPRETVAAIRALNELTSAQIHPGQILAVECLQSPEPVQLAAKP